jgi:heme A synthase
MFAYLLIVLGDTVRVTKSGMGCRSWPLCNGQLGLAGNYHAILEQSHRYLAAVVTILVVASFAMAWRRARGDRLVLWSGGAALGLIGVQVLLGALTVFAHNAGWTVALHLAGAWLVAGAVTLTVMAVWRPAVPAPDSSAPRAPRVSGLGVATVISLFALAVSGMLVLHEGAATACPGWPVCGLGGPASLLSLQYLHRSLALVTAVFITAAAVRAWRYRRPGRVLAAAALILLAGTATFGAIVATTGAPPAGQDLHLAIGSALWITVVAMASLLMPAAGRTGADTPAVTAPHGARLQPAGTAARTGRPPRAPPQALNRQDPHYRYESEGPCP